MREFQLKGLNMTSDEVKALLNEKYSDADQSLIAFEVNEGTGSSSGRRIDALVFNLWPSKDYEIIGFEIKVSRSDWLNELKQPEKSLPIAQFCDRFYLVAPAGVLGIDELPKSWGYIQASQDKLLTKIKAPLRESISPDRPFMASLVRQMTRKYSDKDLLKAQVEKMKDRIEADFKNRTKRDFQHLNDEIASLNKIIRDFNQQTGLDMSKYNFGRIVEAVNALRNVKTKENYITDLTNQIASLESILSGAKKSLESLSSIKLPTSKE